jgi:GTP-binding protein EngB required for normal cell division
VGDSGVGKSSLVNLITTEKPARGTKSTTGCQVSIKLVNSSSSSSTDQQGSKFFVEFWDVSGLDYYSGLRRVCYKQLNGVILVYDAADKRSLRRLQKWAVEVQSNGTFVAPFPDDTASKNIGGLPVPVLVVGNKADRVRGASSKQGGPKPSICSTDAVTELCTSWLRRGRGPAALLRQRVRASDVNLQEMEKHVQGLQASAATGQIDWGTLNTFFNTLWTRRYQPTSVLMAAPTFVQPMGVSSSTADLLGRQQSEADMDRVDSDWV